MHRYFEIACFSFLLFYSQFVTASNPQFLGYVPFPSGARPSLRLDEAPCWSKTNSRDAAICWFRTGQQKIPANCDFPNSVYLRENNVHVSFPGIGESYFDWFQVRCRGSTDNLMHTGLNFDEPMLRVYRVYGCVGEHEIPIPLKNKDGFVSIFYYPRDSYPSDGDSVDYNEYRGGYTCLPYAGDHAEPLPEKSNGTAGLCGQNGLPGLTAGNPIVITTGNKVHIEKDYVGEGPFPLVFQRTYNSQTKEPRYASPLLAHGGLWQHNFERKLLVEGNSVFLIRGDGQVEHFYRPGSRHYADLDRPVSLKTKTPKDPYAGYVFKDEAGIEETLTYPNSFGAVRLLQIKTPEGFIQNLSYDKNGYLSAVSDSFGRKLRFEYRAGEYRSTQRLIAMIDPANQKTEYLYNSDDLLSQVTHPDGRVTQYHYENETDRRLLTGITDGLGNRYATWRYDAKKRAVSSEHSNGIERVSLSYEDTNNQVRIVDSWGKERTYQYKNIQGVQKPTFQSGGFCPDCAKQISVYEYDANGLISKIIDNLGHATTQTFDTMGLLETLTEGAGTAQANRVHYAWHPTFKTLTELKQPGLTQFWGYNDRGLVVSETKIDTLESKSRTTTHQYNSLGLLSQTNGPRSDVPDITTFAYDNTGNLITSTDALGHVTRLETYDPNGRPQRQVATNGQVTTFQYTPMGRLAEVKTGKAAWRYRYDLNGQLSALTNPLGQTTQWLYDAAHRLIHIKFPGGDRIERILNNASAVTALHLYNSEGALSYQEQYAYNDLGQLVRRTDGAGQTTTYAYDANGQVTTVWDAKARDWQTQYDVRNRPTSLIDSANNTMRLTYNPESQITAATDALGHTTRFTYNGFGELTAVQSPETGQTQYFYNEAGSLKSMRTAEGHQTHYAYDAINRVISELHEDNQHAVTFRYDENTLGIGKRTSAQDDSGTTRYTYDGHGNLASVTLHTGVFETGMRFGYNLNQQLTSLQYPSGSKAEYARNASGRVQHITYHGQSIVAGVKRLPTWNTVSPITQYQLGNGITVLHTYDKAYIRRKTTWSPLPHAEVSFQYDSVYNLIGVETPQATKSYQYDLLDRLVGAKVSSSFLWAYDALGNRLSEQKETLSHSYAYQEESAQLTQAGKMALTHDAAGHVTQKGDYTYTYGSHQQLARVSYQGNLIAKYTYNAAHQRTKKVVCENVILKTKPLITYFVYDLEGHLIAELNNAGTVEREYIYLDQEPVALVESGTVYYFLNSELGAPRLLTDAKQEAVWAADEVPFGEVTIKMQKLTQNIRFPGQYYDAESGLHYNWHRYYDPALGRYLQPDPIGLAGGANLYVYVGNNPVNYIDPLGLFEITVNDPGGRNGPIYGGTITVTGNNGQSVTVPGSSWPNPTNPNPGISPGTYPGTYSPTGHQGRTNGVRVNNGGGVPTLGPNPTQGGRSTATGINLHCGYRENRRGSAGCLTIEPEYCQRVWDLLQPGETGNITIQRGDE